MSIDINIGKDFSRHPAGRTPKDGKYNGQTFREKFIVPYLKEDKTVRIFLDDAIHYGSSFLEEAFGGLIRVEGYSPDFLSKHIIIVTEDTILHYEISQNIKEHSDNTT